MSRARIAAAAALLLAAAAASAFVRSRDARTGRALAWPVRSVAWHLNRDWPNTSNTCEADGASDPTLDAVRAGFAEWEQACTDLRLLFAGTIADISTGLGGDAENLVVFRSGWCSQHPEASTHPCMDDPDVDCGSIFNCAEDACVDRPCDDWNVIALTSVLYDPETGRIVNADIELNGWDGENVGSLLPPERPQNGWYFTCGEISAPCTSYGQPDCRHMDLRNTITHEVGHFIGLNHVPAAQVSSTMLAGTQAGEISKRDLDGDDVAGVCAIYPDQDDGGCGCGAGAAADLVALVVAALALRRPFRARRA